MESPRLPERDRPWMMRTYAGHSTAKRSNELYRRNLAKGQTGLSVAFDLPTQTGYDADHELARGEVGKVGVPIAHRGDMAFLVHDIPLDVMNTSMTINATAAWLLALYIVVAEEQGIDHAVLQGTTQNDILKEYLSRGTYAGHSSAAASNALYRRNLDKGQTGLSVAFDLPTQTGYDPDHPLARGE
ncbi:MAG: methylmalonyl-CoA mutase family protein, partial [Solirubrobacterales bacterium]